MKTLSLLIPTIESRKEMLSELVCGLITQCGSIKAIKTDLKMGCTILIIKFEFVEIIIASDDRVITTGAKRNLLLSLASNDYVSSIDCDDYVYPYYVKDILEAIQSDVDCVAMKGLYSCDGKPPIEWRLAKDFPNETKMEKHKQVFYRTSNHLTPVKRSLSLLAGYPDKSNAEDAEYSRRLNPHLKTEIWVPNLMYHYKYVSHNKSYK